MCLHFQPTVVCNSVMVGRQIVRFSLMPILSILPSVWIGLNQISPVQIFIRNHSSVEFSPVLRGSTLHFLFPLTYLLGLNLILKNNNNVQKQWISHIVVNKHK